MSDWNSDLYRKFENERTRPAIELLRRVPLDSPRTIVDLGCGPGNSTELLVNRFPNAAITGTDSSDDMLRSARERLPSATFIKSDIAGWSPTTPPDLIYSNAALQWVPGHETLMPHLFKSLAPGGVLAIQMPDNQDEPTHRLMREVAVAGPWRDIIGDADKVRARIKSAGEYYDMFTPTASEVDVWRTTYHHVIADAAGMVTWVRATGLRPFIDPLSDARRAEFLRLYQQKIAEAYPARSDGKVLLRFPRLFIVARRT